MCDSGKVLKSGDCNRCVCPFGLFGPNCTQPAENHNQCDKLRNKRNDQTCSRYQKKGYCERSRDIRSKCAKTCDKSCSSEVGQCGDQILTPRAGWIALQKTAAYVGHRCTWLIQSNDTEKVSLHLSNVHTWNFTKPRNDDQACEQQSPNKITIDLNPFRARNETAALKRVCTANGESLVSIGNSVLITLEMTRPGTVEMDMNIFYRRVSRSETRRYYGTRRKN